MTAGGRLSRLAPLVLAAALSACSEVASTGGGGYEPATLEHGPDGEVEHVTFTPEGAERTGLELAMVRRRGVRLVVPYEALIYDGDGKSHVYAVKAPFTFDRAQVDVDRIEHGGVLLRSGPPEGTHVVTVGAAQVYGAELEIAGGH